MNRPYMKRKEWAFLQAHLNKNQVMLEYGSGMSTVAIAPQVKNLWSIEHDETWFYKVKELVAEYSNVNLNLVKNDMTRTLPTKLEQFQTYVNWIKDKDIKFDIVLIDGRARQWCAEAILPKLNEHHYVFLHDFTAERPQYKDVLKYYTIVRQVGSMVLLNRI